MGRPEIRRTLAGEIRKDREAARRQVNTSPFFNTGMHPNGVGGIDSDNFVTDVSGYRLAETPEFNDIKLRGGIVGNEALTNPVSPAQAFTGTGTFALTVAGANIITINKVVPDGFSKCVVNAFGRLAATNSTGALDAVYSAVDVNGAGGNQFGVVVDPGSFGSLSAGYSTLLSGLNAGETVATHLYGSTGLAGWASNPANGADLSVTYLWFR